MADIDIRQGDCLVLLPQLSDNSIDCVVTDPPYFIDGMDDGWEHAALEEKSKKPTVVGGLPVGMKFDPKQSRRLFVFLRKVDRQLKRVLKPGGFLVMFSQARLYHAVALAAGVRHHCCRGKATH